MKGLIYKDITIFFKSIDKKTLLIAVAAIILLLFRAEAYAGLFASIMLAMTIGMQHVLSFASDEKADWKKYQLTMPVSAVSVVTSKYISVLYTLALSLAGSILFNFLSSAILHSFDMVVWSFSLAASFMIPLFWTALCLPLTYWFGFHAAQITALLAVFPMFYIIKYFDDGPGFSAMTGSLFSYGILAGITAVVFFVISMLISMIGYDRKK